MGESEVSCKFKAADRVKRSGGRGCFGTVKDVTTDVTASSAEARERGLVVKVQWDNGTLSALSPDALETT